MESDHCKNVYLSLVGTADFPMGREKQERVPHQRHFIVNINFLAEHGPVCPKILLQFKKRKGFDMSIFLSRKKPTKPIAQNQKEEKKVHGHIPIFLFINITLP